MQSFPMPPLQLTSAIQVPLLTRLRPITPRLMYKMAPHRSSLHKIEQAKCVRMRRSTYPSSHLVSPRSNLRDLDPRHHQSLKCDLLSIKLMRYDVWKKMKFPTWQPMTQQILMISHQDGMHSSNRQAGNRSLQAPSVIRKTHCTLSVALKMIPSSSQMA